MVFTNALCSVISFGGQWIISNVEITNKSFLARVNKIQNVEIDSAASSGGQGKYVKHVSFPWPPLEAAFLIFNARLFVKKQFFEEELIKTKETAINSELQDS
jgi:hypothetical protein